MVNGNGVVRAWNDRLALTRHIAAVILLVAAGAYAWNDIRRDVQAADSKVAAESKARAEEMRKHEERIQKMERFIDEQRWLNGKIEEQGRQTDAKLERLDRNVDRLLRAFGVTPQPRPFRDDGP